MRIWQRSFWGVLALLLCTTTAQPQTNTTDADPALTDNSDKPYTSTSSHDPDLTFQDNKHTTGENPTTTENGESSHNNQLPNYTSTNMNNHHKRTYTLSTTNNNSHFTQQVHPLLFTSRNESTNRHGQLTQAGNTNTSYESDDYQELEQRLSLANLFDEDTLDGHSDNENSVLEAREIEQAADYGLKMMYELMNVKEPELYTKGLWLQPDSAAGRVAAFSAPGPQALRLARFGYAALQASTRLLQQWLGGAEGRAGPLVRLPAELRGSLRGTALQRQCRVLTAPTPCRPAALRYRTADGSCNNLQRPRLGAALSPLQRFLAPRYVDGVQAVRTDLPSPRVVSTRVHRPLHVESPSTTLMLMQWGQFLDHDVTSTPGSRAFNGSTPRCCADAGRAHLPQQLLHPECLPITVPSDDPMLDRFDIRCMEFVRSAPIPREDCDFGHRQQMNQVTSYIDTSTIYGSSAAQADGIRLFRGGLIRFGTPDPPDGGEPCRLGAVSAQCLRPGDARASEQPALTAIHITWVRRHNQLAAAFATLNPHWSDEKLYQEARRLVAASVQHVTYREFLPIILGHEVVRLFDLELLHKGYYAGYDKRVNPAPANSFSAAAYRFGHSLVQNSFIRSDRFHRPIFNNVSLHDEQSNAENIWSPGSIDRLILGLVNQPSQKRDEFISIELTNHLFQSPGSGSNGFGLDLAAINIQRGRDHGLPPYTAWRQPCGLSPVQNWTDLQRVMFPETAERFRSLYLSVDDIDLYSAGLAERPVRGGLLGPTFACIIAQQFSNLRRGDRFWYENGNFESSFTPSQLQQIRKITFAQILCETMPDIETIQPFVFLTSDNFENRRELCKNLVDFDLTPWTENSANEDQSNIFPLPVEPIFENGVENKAESSNRSLSNKEKNSKVNNAHEDIFSFSVSSLKLKTDEKITTDETLKQTIFRREKRQTNDATNYKSLETHVPTDTVEHRESDETNLLTLNNNMTNVAIETSTIPSNITITARSERKHKHPNRRKSKPKPTTPKPVETTILAGIKIKTKNKTDLKHLYYGTDHSTSYYPQHYPTSNDEVLIGTKKPADNVMTYLINSVRKTSTATTTTPKPDYQFHILINYFYNSTTERYPRPTQPSVTRRPTYNYDKPTQNIDYNKYSQSYDYNRPYNKPSNSYNVHDTEYPTPLYSSSPGQTFFNTYTNDKTDFGQNNNRYTTRKPSLASSNHDTEYPNPLYSSSPGQTFFNTYTNDKTDFGQSNNRYTTKKPSLVSSNPITVIEINPHNLPKPENVNRPNIYIVNDNFDTQPLRPTYDYNRYRPQTYNDPETVVYKRPITGHITKVDSKPIVVYEQSGNSDHKHYGTEVVYDNQYFTDNKRPTLYQRPDPTYSYLHDKLDFNDNSQFVKITATKKPIFTAPKPIDDDKRYVRISTVKGHTTKTDSLNPIYISVQNKESDEDLEMTYDDILEVYMKPDEKSVSSTKNSNDLKTSIPIDNDKKPFTDDGCSTEVPRPMDLFIEDDLLEL